MNVWTFNFEAFEFREDLRLLRKTHALAENALGIELEEAYGAVSAYDKREESEQEARVLRDDDGFVVFDERDTLIYQTVAGEKALNSLRKSFVISAFHLWERHARQWSDTQHGKFTTLVGLASDHCYINVSLVDVYFLVNALKHASATWGRPLSIMRPDLFPQHFDRTKRGVEWYDVIEISSQSMTEVFDIVASSGPSMRAFD